MRKLTTIEGYAHRLMRAVERLQNHLKPSTIEYTKLFNENLPKGFDNSNRWRQMDFGDYNYRYGLHNSFAGVIGEVYAEAAWTIDGGDVVQHFSDKQQQVDNQCDQTVYINGAKLYNQCKSARVTHSTGRGSTLVVWERMLDVSLALNNSITLIDIDKKITIALACKQFVDAAMQSNAYGDEIWIPFNTIDTYASIHTFQETI